MLTAICFDNELFLNTYKIRNIFAYKELPAKFAAFQLFFT